MKNDEIKSLTGLRGIAAVAVVFYHFFPETLKPVPVLGTSIIHGYIAVDLFFVLSGFVMSIAYKQRFIQGFDIGAYAGFLYARLCRVYPLYIFVTICIFLTEMKRYNLDSLYLNVTLAQAWGFGDSIGKTTWSISTEMFAYFIFPLACLLLVCRPRYAVIATIAATAAICFVATRSDPQVRQTLRHGALDVYGSHTVFPLIRCVAGFLLGVLAYRCSLTARVRRFANYPFATEIVTVAILCLLAIQGTDVVIVLLFAPLIILLGSTESRVSRVLSGRAIYWLGTVSYSIYLVHRGLYDTLEKPFEVFFNNNHLPHAYTLAGLALLPLVFLVASATYYGIEKPARSMGRELASMRSRSIRSEPSVP